MQILYYQNENGNVKAVSATSELEAVRAIRREIEAVGYTGKLRIYTLNRMMHAPIERMGS